MTYTAPCSQLIRLALLAILVSILLGDEQNNQIPEDSIQTFYPLITNADFDMLASTSTLLSIHAGAAGLDASVLKSRWFTEETLGRKLGGLSLRTAKYFLLDLPVDYFTVVVVHEYAGHGARYRELSMDNIFYAFEWPPPYGKGGAQATHTGPAAISIHELISIWQGGVESQALINRNLSMDWMAGDVMNYREASLYFWSFQVLMSYFGKVNPLAEAEEDNDPQAYVRYVNAAAGFPEDNLQMTTEDLKSGLRINAVNPFVFFSVYSMLKTYLWDGSRQRRIPTLSIGEINFLPALRTGYTPFGMEYHLENYLKVRNRVIMIDLHLGDQTLYDSWGGLGLIVHNFYRRQDWSFDLDMHAWNQPELQFGQNGPIPEQNSIGMTLSIRGYKGLPGMPLPISAVFELGYKTAGFIEGYPMDSGVLITAGIAIRRKSHH